jgi:hypothetical protein
VLVPRYIWSPSPETGTFGSIKKLDPGDTQEVCEYVEGYAMHRESKVSICSSLSPQNWSTFDPISHCPQATCFTSISLYTWIKVRVFRLRKFCEGENGISP